MRNNFIKGVMVLVVTLTFSCKEDTESNSIITNKETPQQVTVKKSTENLNISFLLDLSDRISPTKYPNSAMEYYQRDVAYIKSVSEAFNTHLKGKKVRQMNDKIQLYFDPEPRNPNINSISNGLKYVLNRNNVTLNKLNEIEESYNKKPQKIYDLAIADNKYVGSDTWRFFKTKVQDYCIEDNYRNILVILTDGYIYHEDTKIKEDNLTSYITPRFIRDAKLNNKNWESKITEKQYGFIPVAKDLSNLEILVLGLNPSKTNPYEEEILKKYWSDWFNNMKVGRYQIKSTALPSNMDKIIKDFILNK